MTLIWHYLAFETELKTTKTEIELEAVEEITLKVIQEIESAQDFPTKESALCDWCEYREHCPLFGGAETDARLRAGHGPGKPEPASTPPAIEGPDGQLRLL